MKDASPALLTRSGAQPLPRVALWLFAAAYLLPGIVGRDPWRHADLTSYAVMASMAEGRSPWLAPTLGGVPVDTALLPHWLGAGFVALLGPWIGGPMAARLPFAALLALTMILVWYTAYHLARTEAAQPVAFAFGGEADPQDYARAIGDAAVLALIATLGLLQLGHETTPELAQLASVAGVLWALAAVPYRPQVARLAAVAALCLLALSGAPAVAVAMGLGAGTVCWLSSYAQARRAWPWMLAGTLLAALGAAAADTWAMRLANPLAAGQPWSIARQWLWFLWPVWPAMLWALWRWRRHWNHRHVSVPLVAIVAGLLTNVLMAGADRALLLALPGCAVLAAFALPTLRRSASAAVDWLSMSFFTLSALAIWVVYISLMTGVPAKPAANVAKLAPGFEAAFHPFAFGVAVVATLAWIALVRWRTGRHRDAVWKSMVIPAGGVALCWMLLTTLWLPMLDYARSLRPWVERVEPLLAGAHCVAAPGVGWAHVAALETQGRLVVHVDAAAAQSCPLRLALTELGRQAEPPEGWRERARLRRPSDRRELTLIWERVRP